MRIEVACENSVVSAKQPQPSNLSLSALGSRYISQAFWPRVHPTVAAAAQSGVERPEPASQQDSSS